jgi:uncharacterized SAM-binding protein YcdF (DUF218 family)
VTYVEPLLLVFFLFVFVGFLRARRSPGSRAVAAGLVGLFLLSWPPVDWLLSRHLESRYAKNPDSLESGQSIVVLASSATPPRYGIPYYVPDKDTYERCALEAWLHTHGHPLPILACGGGNAPGRQPIAETMRQLLQGAGVSESMIWTERESRSTHENPAFGAAILPVQGIGTIILVTEALKDMLRAELCFRKEGLAVIPFPIAVRHVGPDLRTQSACAGPSVTSSASILSPSTLSFGTMGSL